MNSLLLRSASHRRRRRWVELNGKKRKTFIGPEGFYHKDQNMWYWAPVGLLLSIAFNRQLPTCTDIVDESVSEFGARSERSSEKLNISMVALRFRIRSFDIGSNHAIMKWFLISVRTEKMLNLHHPGNDILRESRDTFNRKKHITSHRRSLQSSQTCTHFFSGLWSFVCNLIDTLRFYSVSLARLCSLPRRYEQLNHIREQKEMKKLRRRRILWSRTVVVKANDSCWSEWIRRENRTFGNIPRPAAKATENGHEFPFFYPRILSHRSDVRKRKTINITHHLPRWCRSLFHYFLTILFR